MKLKTIKLTDLKPLKENVRVHSEKQIDELVRSLKQFGQTRAIVIDEENNILIGNGLYFALEKMGATEAECFVKTGLNETQKKKLILTDNRVYSLGSDDYQGIEKFVNEITQAGDFDIAGFDTYTLEMMTISDEDNEDLMQDYGKVEDKKFTEPQPQKETPATTTNEPSKAVNPENNNEQVNDEVTEHAEDQNTPAERKSVICPNCGEVIYLD